MTEQTFEEKYPEHTKLDPIKEDSQTIGLFLDTLGQQGIVLCEYHKGVERHFPTSKSIEQILADYYGIDSKALQEEKHRMLEEFRNNNR